MDPLWLLLLGLAAAAAAILAGVVLVWRVTARVWPQSFNDKAQALASLFSMVLGTAAALAGAYATLNVATLGLSLAERQYEQNSRDFVEPRLEEAANIYNALSVGLSRYFIATQSFGAAFSNASVLDAPARRQARRQLDDSLSGLIAAFERLLSDGLAYDCFLRQAAAVEGPPGGAAAAPPAIDSANPIGLLMGFEALRARVDENADAAASSAALVELQTSRVVPALTRSAELRTLVYAGALLGVRTLREDAGEIVHNDGLVALVATLERLPEQAELKACMQESYPQLSAVTADASVIARAGIAAAPSLVKAAADFLAAPQAARVQL